MVACKDILVSLAVSLPRSASPQESLPFNQFYPPCYQISTKQISSFQLTKARQVFAGNLANFNMCNLIVWTILSDLHHHWHKDSLENLINKDTGVLEGIVPSRFSQTLQHLQVNHPTDTHHCKGQTARGNNLELHAKPLVLAIFTAINNYANMLARPSCWCILDTRTTHYISLIIISGATIFAREVCKKHDRPEADKT